jgi:tetratricopeptide (TPR) repeat protein
VIDIARKNNVIEVLGHALAYKAIALARVGRFDDSRAVIAEALEVEKITVHPVKRADIHIGVASALYDMDEIEEGLEHARIGADLAFDARGLECACAGYYTVGWGKLEQHRIEDALVDLGRSLTLANEARFEGYVNIIHGSIAAAEFEKGQTAAVERIRVAADNARNLGDHYAESLLRLPLGRSLLKLGQTREALAEVDAAIAYFRDRSMAPYLAHGLRLRADIAEAAGMAEEAAAARSEAEQVRTTMGMPAAAIASGSRAAGN